VKWFKSILPRKAVGQQSIWKISPIIPERKRLFQIKTLYLYRIVNWEQMLFVFDTYGYKFSSLRRSSEFARALIVT